VPVNDASEPSANDRVIQPVQAADQLSARINAPLPVLDVAGFTAFYRAEVTTLVRFLLNLGATLTDAADLAQDTMIDAYKSWCSIQRPRAWIRRVASRKYGHRRYGIEVLFDPVDGGPLLAQTHLDQRDWEHRQEILRLVANLPWRQRQVMAWTIDGYEPHEIASELGIKPEAVRGSLKLARRALAAQLAEGDLR
jgi:RNA polymerase sigma factor (sigma-70 family)